MSDVIRDVGVFHILNDKRHNNAGIENNESYSRCIPFAEEASRRFSDVYRVESSYDGIIRVQCKGMNSLTQIYKFAPVSLIRQWLNSVEIHCPEVARLLCKIIPARCPFERKIRIFDRTIVSIPPLCKLNPFYNQIIEIRFKSLVCLADECNEDVTRYR